MLLLTVYCSDWTWIGEMTVKGSANSVILILFAFSDNLSAEKSKSSADFYIQLIQLLECMAASRQLNWSLQVVKWSLLFSLQPWRTFPLQWTSLNQDCLMALSDCNHFAYSNFSSRGLVATTCFATFNFDGGKLLTLLVSTWSQRQVTSQLLESLIN